MVIALKSGETRSCGPVTSRCGQRAWWVKNLWTTRSAIIGRGTTTADVQSARPLFNSRSGPNPSSRLAGAKSSLSLSSRRRAPGRHCAPQRQSVSLSPISQISGSSQTQGRGLPCLYSSWGDRAGPAAISRGRRSQASMGLVRILAPHHSSPASRPRRCASRFPIFSWFTPKSALSRNLSQTGKTLII